MVKQLIVVVSTLRTLLDSFSFCQCWFLLFQQEFNSQPELVQQIVTIRSTSINETLICPGRDYLIFEETHSCMSHHQAGRQAIQLLNPVWLFATLWTAASQASLSITNSQSLLKLMSIESVMLSNHLTLCFPLLLLPSIFPSIRIFSNELLFTSGGQSIGASASASVLPMNIQGWFHLGLTGLLYLLSKRLSRVFSSTAISKHQFFRSQFSLWSNFHIHTWLLEKQRFDFTD